MEEFSNEEEYSPPKKRVRKSNRDKDSKPKPRTAYTLFVKDKYNEVRRVSGAFCPDLAVAFPKFGRTNCPEKDRGSVEDFQ